MHISDPLSILHIDTPLERTYLLSWVLKDGFYFAPDRQNANYVLRSSAKTNYVMESYFMESWDCKYFFLVQFLQVST